MHNGRMRHAILGSGGVGGVLGACPADVGRGVTWWYVRLRLRISGRTATGKPAVGNFTVPVEKSPMFLRRCFWIAVKATQLESALRSVPDPRAASTVVPLQNGIDHVARLREDFRHDRVVAGTIAGEMERIAPGRMVHPSPFLMMNIASSGRGLLGGVAEKLATLHCRAASSTTRRPCYGSELVFLGPFALTTSAGRRADWRSPRRRPLAPANSRIACGNSAQ